MESLRSYPQRLNKAKRLSLTMEETVASMTIEVQVTLWSVIVSLFPATTSLYNLYYYPTNIRTIIGVGM